MMLRPLFVTLLVVTCIKSYSHLSYTDTTQIATQLDSAFRLMKKVDQRAVPFLSELLRASRAQDFRRGEAEALFCLGEYYSLHEEDSKSWQYFDSARIAFEAINKKGRWAQSLNMLGSLKIRASQYRQSIPYFKKAAEINKAIGRKQQLGDCYYNLATVSKDLGDYVKAIEYFLEVLKLDEETGYKEGMADDYGQIGNIYAKIRDFPQATESHKKSIEISEASGSKPTMSSSYTHYGLMLKNIGQFKEARVMLQRALDICKELKSPRQLATALHNMAALNYAEGVYNEAIQFYEQSLSHHIESLALVNDEGLAQVYLKLNKYSKAIEFAKRAMRMAEESKSMDSRKRLNLLLADIASAQRDYKLALSYYKQHSILKDSLLDSEKNRQIQDMQAKYDSEKKENEIATLTQERELQDVNLRQKATIQYVLIIGVIMLIIFGVITFFVLRGRQEARRQLFSQQLKSEQQEAERVKELDRLKSRFFANVAHEFRTPLTLILGPVENLLNESRQSTDREQLTLVRNNTTRLVRLVNQLLDLSKLEAGNITFEYVHEDIIPFLKSIAFSFQSLADQKRISVTFTSDPASIVTKFDRDKLEKIFSNLLSNAFKFTPEEGQVIVDVRAQDQQIRVDVTDSGSGIAAEDLPYIFNRFYQSGTSSRSTTGIGIGLELTKELVGICGGNIGVKNVPSGGAQFEVVLPLITEGASIIGSQKYSYQHTPVISSTTLLGNGEVALTTDDEKDSILVIEDNPEVRNFIVQSLRERYQVLTAENGGEGIEKALSTVPDLVITDVMMPVKDGFEVCRTLKEAQETSHVPVIMLTAKADVESRIEGLETGADDYLAKPFHTKELLTRIQNLIDVRKKLQKKFRAESSESATKQIVDELPLREKQFLKRLHELIENHLADEEYSVDGLSRDMAMSRMQLHRKLKALTDTPTSLYIRFIRLDRGKQLLEEGYYNVSEVAYRVGFNSPTYFSTCFSERFGFPPSETRRVEGK